LQILEVFIHTPERNTDHDVAAESNTSISRIPCGRTSGNNMTNDMTSVAQDLPIREKIVNAVFRSMGRTGAPNREVFFARIWPFILISVSKLTVAAYAWSWGFILVDGDSCWGSDTTFQHAPRDTDACTMNALVLSGFMASTSLLVTLYLLEYLLVEERDLTSQWTYLLLFFSVWVSDSSWSYWNWFSFSISNSLDSDQEYDVGAYAWASLLGFGFNAATFFALHNTGRQALIRWTPGTAEDIWYCDIPFTINCFGAYYGFGPWAVYLSKALGTTTGAGVAFTNAMGTFLGACLTIALCYLVPILLWLPPSASSEENAAVHITDTSALGNSMVSIMRESSVELSSVSRSVSDSRVRLSNTSVDLSPDGLPDGHANQSAMVDISAKPNQIKEESSDVENPMQCADVIDTSDTTIN